MFPLPKAPSLDLRKVYEIKYRFMALCQNTPARTACVFASILETAKAYCDTRSASSISRSLLHRRVLSPTSRATVDISCSSRPFSYLSTTPRLSDLAMAKTLGGISTGQEKSGFLILGQKCRKDTLLLLDYRNGWQ